MKHWPVAVETLASSSREICVRIKPTTLPTEHSSQNLTHLLFWILFHWFKTSHYCLKIQAVYIRLAIFTEITSEGSKNKILLKMVRWKQSKYSDIFGEEIGKRVNKSWHFHFTNYFPKNNSTHLELVVILNGVIDGNHFESTAILNGIIGGGSHFGNPTNN